MPVLMLMPPKERDCNSAKGNGQGSTRRHGDTEGRDTEGFDRINEMGQDEQDESSPSAIHRL
jgi:hypothetical protein